MTILTDLSAELVLCIASYVRRVDLLNLSLTCRYIQQVTESQLFRVYRRKRIGGSCLRSNYIIHILQNPRLARYVKEIEVKRWDDLGNLGPHFYVIPRDEQDREAKQAEFDRFQAPTLTEEDYLYCAQAAKSSGIIKNIYPYEHESMLIKKARTMLPSDEAATPPNAFYRFLLDDQIPFEEIPFDRKFCQLLRAGVEDANIMLLLAILPNVTSIFFRGPNTDPTNLSWPLPNHKFNALRQLKAGQCDLLRQWGIGYLNTILQSATQLESLLLHHVSSWRRNDTFELELPQREMPLVLQPGSLRVTKIELVSCALDYPDMKTLIDACPSLVSLHYSTGSEETGLCSVDPSQLVHILDNHKSTLQELHSEICHFWGTYDDQFNFITSLSHFTALKVLDTTADMWENMIDEDFRDGQVSEEVSLSSRLPRSLESLIFHFFDSRNNPEYSTPATIQIIDLLRNRKSCTPALKTISVGLRDSVEACHFRKEVKHMIPDPKDLEFKMLIGKRAQGPPANSFTGTAVSHDPPITKWFGNKYAMRRMKRPAYEIEMSRLCDLPENRHVGFENMMAIIKRDEKMQELLAEMQITPSSEAEFESEDVQEDSDEYSEEDSEFGVDELPRRYTRDDWNDSDEDESSEEDESSDEDEDEDGDEVEDGDEELGDSEEYR